MMADEIDRIAPTDQTLSGIDNVRTAQRMATAQLSAA
jgi:hypothetical protein